MPGLAVHGHLQLHWSALLLTPSVPLLGPKYRHPHTPPPDYAMRTSHSRNLLRAPRKGVFASSPPAPWPTRERNCKADLSEGTVRHFWIDIPASRGPPPSSSILDADPSGPRFLRSHDWSRALLT